MEDTIKLLSRGGAKNYLHTVKNKSGKTYTVKFDPPIFRMGYTNEGKKFIDPSGGPMIIEGESLKEANSIIDSIEFATEHGCIVIFK